MHVMPFLLHSITLDWSIGLILEFRFHLTNSPISRLDQTPKPLYFFLKKSRFSDLRKKGKIWSIWGGSNLKNDKNSRRHRACARPPHAMARRPHDDMWMPLWNCLPKQNARAREMPKREEESSQHACRNFCKWWEYRLD